MRIDSHNHFWKYDPVAHAWIDNSMSILKKDFLPEEFEAILSRHKIEGTIAVQADQSESETHFLLHLAEKYKIVKGVVGWVDLRAPDIEERLSYFSKFPSLVGFRHILQSEPDPDFMLGEDFQRGLSFLKNYGFTYDILIFHKQMDAALQTIRQHSEQKFVIDHIAKPAIKDNKISAWSDKIRAIANHPNVMCKLSGIITEADWNTWNAKDITPYLDVVMDAFGVDRVMYGSDWPVCLLAGSYQQVYELVEDYFDQFSEADKSKLFGENATYFYGLKD